MELDLERVADILGVTTLIGAVVAQVPQIIAILKSKNVEGLSFNGFVIETFSLTIQVLYFVAKKYAFTAYADISLLLIQDYVLIVLLMLYSKLTFMEYGQVAGYAFALGSVILGTVSEDLVVSTMQGVVLLNIASKVSFIVSILESKDTSAMEPAGWAIFVYSNLVRIFVGALVLKDNTIVAQHVVNAVANFTVLMLVFKYRDGKKEVEKKEE